MDWYGQRVTIIDMGRAPLGSVRRYDPLAKRLHQDAPDVPPGVSVIDSMACDVQDGYGRSLRARGGGGGRWDSGQDPEPPPDAIVYLSDENPNGAIAKVARDMLVLVDDGRRGVVIIPRRMDACLLVRWLDSLTNAPLGAPVVPPQQGV